ncbi:AI-2E family transporter [Larkinella soli]|uniref:AI-2E family transporter n=1 Tax=Larkinella soli TaxID=1770527 RepID=UPI000FFC4FAC|nr:AI-2E family transporter [Larkinella soli]
MKRRTLQNLEVILLLIILLYIGRPLFIPLSFAVLISFVSYPVCRYLEKKGWPRSLAIAACLLGLLLFFAGIGGILITGILQVAREWDVVSREFGDVAGRLMQFLNDRFNLTPEQQSNYLRRSGQEALSSVGAILGSLVSFSATSLAMLIIIPVFVALILANREILVAALMAWLPERFRQTGREVLHESVAAYYQFVKGMAIVYLVVGILNSVGLALFGIENFLFFGFLASILTFIPYFGILIGGAVPVAVAWTGSPAQALGVVLMFAFVQYLEANLIFPRAVGHRLKINTLVMLISIILGGLLWGGAGLVVIPPMIGILKIVADKIEDWKPLAILLGTDETEDPSAPVQRTARE